MEARGSAISDWKNCRRLYGFQWVDGWESKLPNVHLLTGTLVHAGLARLHHIPPGNPLHGIEGAHRVIFDEATAFTERLKLSAAQIEIVDTAYKLACTMVTAYFAHYAGKPWPKALQVEAQFRLRVKDRHVLTGTIDMLVDDEDGELVVWEHKTTSDTRQAYDDVAAFRWQTFGYFLGARTLTGRWPKYIVYNILGKPTIRQSKKESRDEYYARALQEYQAAPDDYFRRAIVRVGHSHLAQYVKQLASVLHDMECTPRELYYSNDGNCIRGRGMSCQFLETCSAHRNEPDARLFAKTHEVIREV